MIQGLLLFQNPQLRMMAQGIPGAATLDSKTKRISRFLKAQLLDRLQVGRFILSLFAGDQKYIIPIDRTHWTFGNHQNNLLMGGILVDDISVPLVCMNLDKAGNSNTAERNKFLKCLLKIIPWDRIECLLADREFIGEEWFQNLISRKIPFAIRIKSNTLMVDPQTGQKVPVSEYFRRVKKGTYEVQTIIWGHPIRVVFVKKRKSIDGALFLAVSAEDFKPCWIKKYKNRWSIERMFLSMKTKGFNVERTHLMHPDRLETLILVVSIAFALAVKAGRFLKTIRKIPIKKHGRRLYSIFTYGLNWIKETWAENAFRKTSTPYSALNIREAQKNVRY